MKNFPEIGIQIPEVLLPKKELDQAKWAVIACDQFTSQPEYWTEVAAKVGDSPSTYHLILPEVFLGTQQEKDRIQSTQLKMREYLSGNLFSTYEHLIFVERSVAGKVRRGIMLALDLEQYDFNPGSQSLIRATEGTILDRLPPRIRIREGAALELPHIMVLIDDPEDKVLGPIEKQKTSLPTVYDFDLMLGSGHLSGRLINDDDLERSVIRNLNLLGNPETFRKKYDVTEDKGVLLFAVGDGNHSLATAKAIWEKVKPAVGMEHPARYALVEIENIHDSGLEFEPIHRVLFGVKEDPMDAFNRYFGGNIHFENIKEPDKLKSILEKTERNFHRFGLVMGDNCYLAIIKDPTANLPVGSVQPVLDKWLREDGFDRIDYVHGEAAVRELCQKEGNAGIILAPMPKNELFRTVILDGALPRKTFSMGEAYEKRFYMECRKIL